VRQSPASKDLNTEVEGSTVLEAVTRQRLVKTDLDDLARAISGLQSVLMSDSAIVTCS
jgi:hypothetical protein